MINVINHVHSYSFAYVSISNIILKEHLTMVSWPAFSLDNFQATPGEHYQGPPRNLKPIQEYKVKPELLPPNYEIKGTDPASKILFVNVHIIDSSGREPYKGSVYIQGSCLSFSLAY